MNDIDRITSMLSHEALEKRMAAAIVLGELKAKGPKVADGLRGLLDGGIPALQRHALDALARIGAKRALPSIFPLLHSPDLDVRQRAAHAIASIGPEVVPEVQARMTAATPDERRALDSVLAELGGKDAFSALLAGLLEADEDAAKAAALSVRQHVKETAPKERRGYLSQVERFLRTKSTQASVAATAGALKILGYLEDERAIPTLVAFAKSNKAPPVVRQEAILSLRFVLSKSERPTKEIGKVVDVLMEVAEANDRALAMTAVHTLATMPSASKIIAGFARLSRHPDFERARFAIEHLGRVADEAALVALAETLRSAEKSRAELAAHALQAKANIAGPVTKVLLTTRDPDKAWLLRTILRNEGKNVPPALRKQLLTVAVEKLKTGERGWEAFYEVARDGDSKSAAVALRTLAESLRKSKKSERAAWVYRVLCRGEHATDEDKYALSMLELVTKRLDTHAAARGADEVLHAFEKLAARGFDVAARLRKERSLGPEALYYLGFHFAEKDHPLGEELLGEVVSRAGRTKMGKMAKNKLALVERRALA